LVDLPAAPPGSKALFPWPRLPNGFLTFEEWAPSRFESWLLYHQNIQEEYLAPVLMDIG
jgi:hypothetical protein